jgi:hypothetical protein
MGSAVSLLQQQVEPRQLTFDLLMQPQVRILIFFMGAIEDCSSAVTQYSKDFAFSIENFTLGCYNMFVDPNGRPQGSPLIEKPAHQHTVLKSSKRQQEVMTI